VNADLRGLETARMNKVGEADLRAEPLVTGVDKSQGEKILKRFEAERHKN
jgi:hypothetical protein